MKKPVLVKEDRMDGLIFVCPHCHCYICSTEEKCIRCSGEIDWSKRELYKGKVVFDGK